MVLVASAVAGCGRRGRLEPPPDPNAPAQTEPSKTGFKKRPPNPPIRPPDTPFILDPLVK